ncbi:hypothetical protein ACNFIC_11705 [Pseudomonas sp. NY15463]|uniref:hypothetical protein n=1 Tax=Pseudomonas sp. NY15463 TaxID=3400361 RepID=UPI003A8A00EC
MEAPSMSNDPTHTQYRPPSFFIVAPKKLAVLTFFTFGLYWFFCFHRHWVHQRRARHDKTWPLMRALWQILYFYPLMRRIEQSLRSSGQRCRWSSLGLFMLYLFSVVPLLLLDEKTLELLPVITILLIFSSLALLTWVVVWIQRAVNLIEGDEAGSGNARMSWANWLWMAPGFVFWGIGTLALVLTLLLEPLIGYR